MRKAIVLVLTCSLLAGAMIAPAEAKKKKKKAAAPITFEASGAFALANPLDLNDAGITRNEFQATCGVPASQGVDGFVIELSEEISKVAATASISGTDATGIYDIDMYFYDADCALVGSASTEVANEVGLFAAGTKWVVVTAFFGVELEFDLSATELQL